MKVLFAGLGSVGQRHVRNLRKLCGNNVELLAWRCRGFGRVITEEMSLLPNARAEDYYQIESFSVLSDALAQNPTVVFITNPSSKHIGVALEAAQAGCHLFIEKPLSHDLEGVEELMSLVEKRDLVTMVGYQMRFHPCWQLVKRLVEDEAIGSLLAAHFEIGEYLPGFHKYEDYRQMFEARRDLGGGVILSQIHELDLIYWLFGLPGRVFALGGHWSSLEIETEDVANILFECSYMGRSLPVSLHQDFIQQPSSRCCKIIGEKGNIVVSLYSPEVAVIMTNKGAVKRYSFDKFERNQLFLDEISHFFSCIKSRQKPMISLAEGVQSLRMALAAHQSIDTSQAVVL